MGPAYLLDVVGIDTGVHAAEVMAEGFPSRMQREFTSATDVLFKAERLGQKNGKGFYNYALDKKGKLVKVATDESVALIAPHITPDLNLTKVIDLFSDEDIILRMMIPMATELARCLEEGIVASPAEADMALIYGLGFPPFRGGVCCWMDNMGLDVLCESAKRYSHLGELYQPTAGMLALAASGEGYYSSQCSSQPSSQYPPQGKGE
jgi:3-hydroxyacyl-CoA dehydrogenase/enoyl-CoA hydratase/3-hydroxybutyryl-CoA epimerase/enoyl-CoA isomerase